MDEQFARGSEETIEYRGRTITIWRTSEHVRRRIIRRWYYHLGQDGLFQAFFQSFKTREEAIWTAKVHISGQTWRLHLRDIFGDQIDLDDDLDLDDTVDPTDAATSTPSSGDKQARVRKKLETVTVENGFTLAEEATAKQKLASM